MELFASTSSGDDDSIRVWDIHTGAELWSRKDASAQQRTLSIIGDDVLVASPTSKKEFRFWSLSNTATIPNQGRCSCWEKMECLATTSDGMFCAGGTVSGKVYIWETTSGAMLRYWDAHYSAVTVLAFTEDNLCLVSAESHAYIRVWKLAEVLDVSDRARAKQPEAFRVWSDHTLPVTDLDIGVGGAACRIMSSSLDQSVKMWCLATGNLLATVIFPAKCMAVVTDPAERDMYAGGSDGVIYPVSLSATPTSHWDEQGDLVSSNAFRGHKMNITALQTSADGRLLLSASADASVRVWDVGSRAAMRVFDSHKGVVTNLCPLGLMVSATWKTRTKLSGSTSGITKGENNWRVKPFLKDVQSQAATFTTEVTLASATGPSGPTACSWAIGWLDNLPVDWPDAHGRRRSASWGCTGPDEVAIKRFKTHTGRGWEENETDVEKAPDQAELAQKLNAMEQERDRWRELAQNLHKFCADEVAHTAR
jgi:pre-rRNA-processing protein IPI3